LHDFRAAFYFTFHFLVSSAKSLKAHIRIDNDNGSSGDFEGSEMEWKPAITPKSTAIPSPLSLTPSLSLGSVETH